MQTTSNFIKGMNQDVHPKYQVEGSYRMALNSVLETSDGELPVISNELGNIKCANDFPESKTIIGHTLLPDNTVVLFLYDPSGIHEIGLYDPSHCSYTTKMKGECLNFSDKHQINAIFRIKNGCDIIVYFASDDNDYRVTNISNLDKIVDENNFIIDCSSILYTKEYIYPCLRMLEGEGDTGIQDTSGSLEVGTYYFSLRYLDYEQNSTDWLFTTRPVAVGDELYRYVYNISTVGQYDGGSNNIDSDYYVAKTNKVININVINPDKRYPFVQFAVIKRTSDSGGITDVHILNPHPIPQDPLVSSFIYTYTGLDSQVQSETSLQDILTPRKKVDKVKAHVIHDNRLMIGNVSQNYKDYSSYQRFASKIKTEWTKIKVNTPQNSRNKQASYYFYDASFMEDEIYALGIVYIHKDGTQSPVCHIPGRPLNDVTNNAFNPHIGSSGVATDGGNWDDEDGLIEARAYGSVWNSAKTKRWQVTSTAYKYGPNGPLRGMMGYHETTTKYPEVKECSNHPDGYWGRDYKGNLITPSSNIRHHRMPGSELTDTTGDAHAHKTGVRFTNVEYPNSDIVAHFFVTGDRTTQKTIMAKGLLLPIFEYNTEFEGLYFNNTSLCPPNNYTWPIGDANNQLNKRIFAFVSSDGLFDNKSYQASYIKVEKVLEDPQFNVDGGASNAKDYAYNDIISLEPYQVLIRLTHSEIWRMGRYVPPKAKNYGVTNAAHLQKAAVSSKIGDFILDSNSLTKVYNNSVSTNIQVLVTDSTSDSPVEHIRNQSTGRISQNKLLYASVRQDVDVFNNLASIEYNRLDNCKQVSIAPENIFTSYSGDTFIAKVNITDQAYYQQGNSATNSTIHEDIRMVSYSAEECNMNPEFRHGGKKSQNFYFKYPFNYDHKPLREYAKNKTFNVYNTTFNDADRYIYGLYPEEYNYNKSYSYLSTLEKYLPPPLFYDFCNECVDDNPYRIYASEFDVNEGAKDLYRIILENNYKDLEGYTGEITDLFLSFDKLYAATTTSLFHVPTKFNVLNTDSSTAYLGTGEIFSIPPKEMKNVDFAFGGMQHFKSRVSTEYGTFYMDALSKRPILFTDNFNDLSNTGLRSFFQENGGIMFLEQFKSLTGSEYTNYSTSSLNGVGYISTYDPRYKRIIIHKRDFMIVPQYQFSFKYQQAPINTIINPNDSIIFNGDNFYYRDKDGVDNLITMENNDFFENKSFTISYSFLTNSFVSFHSYLPNYLFNDKSTFFSCYNILDASPYKHSKGNYQTYYNYKYDHVIDLIARNNPSLATIPTNLFYYSTSYLDNSIRDDYTYDFVTLYNSNQSTGKLKLKSKTPFEFDNAPTEALVSKVDKYYRINNIRNVSTDTPIWTSEWNLIKSFPYSYTDKIVFDNNMDYTGFNYTSDRLRDFYTGVRFYFNPDLNIKITTDLVNTVQANRHR